MQSVGWRDSQHSDRDRSMCEDWFSTGILRRKPTPSPNSGLFAQPASLSSPATVGLGPAGLEALFIYCQSHRSYRKHFRSAANLHYYLIYH